MNIKNLRNNVIVGILAGCIMASIGVLPFTQSTVIASDYTITEEYEASEERQGLTPFQQLDAKLDTLVNSGAITKSIKDNIINYMNQKLNELDRTLITDEIEGQTYLTNQPDLANELFYNGIISQDQISTIQQVLPTISAPSENEGQAFGNISMFL